MATDIDPVREEIKRYADEVRRVRPDADRVVLFGKYAHGNFDMRYDVDIAVIFRDFSSISELRPACGLWTWRRISMPASSRRLSLRRK
ncbi:MAG: nucleotidyltransferase domain-containing protein [Deltaproteobacteria bacterium]|nr:nucleotidyltransferase domain-containing protein [Deltaproteobacteria bacterium]